MNTPRMSRRRNINLVEGQPPPLPKIKIHDLRAEKPVAQSRRMREAKTVLETDSSVVNSLPYEDGDPFLSDATQLIFDHIQNVWCGGDKVQAESVTIWLSGCLQEIYGLPPLVIAGDNMSCSASMMHLLQEALKAKILYSGNVKIPGDSRVIIMENFEKKNLGSVLEDKGRNFILFMASNKCPKDVGCIALHCKPVGDHQYNMKLANACLKCSSKVSYRLGGIFHDPEITLRPVWKIPDNPKPSAKNDHVGDFLKELFEGRCGIPEEYIMYLDNGEETIETNHLYDIYSEWCRGGGERPMWKNGFLHEVVARTKVILMRPTVMRLDGTVNKPSIYYLRNLIPGYNKCKHVTGT